MDLVWTAFGPLMHASNLESEKILLLEGGWFNTELMDVAFHLLNYYIGTIWSLLDFKNMYVV